MAVTGTAKEGHHGVNSGGLWGAAPNDCDHYSLRYSPTNARRSAKIRRTLGGPKGRLSQTHRYIDNELMSLNVVRTGLVCSAVDAIVLGEIISIRKFAWCLGSRQGGTIHKGFPTLSKCGAGRSIADLISDLQMYYEEIRCCGKIEFET